MKYFSLVKKILTKNEINSMYFVCALMVINSILEVISIGAILPLLSIMMGGELDNPLLSNIHNFFNNKNISLNINSLLIIILVIYVTKYLFLLYFVNKQASFVLNLRSHLSTRIFQNTLKKKFAFYEKNPSSSLIRNIKQEVDMFCNGLVSPILSLVLAFFTVSFLVVFLLLVNLKATLAIIVFFSIAYYFVSKMYSSLLDKLGKLRQFHEKNMLKYLLQSLRSIAEVKIFKLQKYYKTKFFFHNNSLANQLVSKAIYGAMPKILFEFLIILITFSFIAFFSFNNLSLKDLFAQILIYSVAVYRLLPSVTGIARHEQKIKYATPAANTIKNFLDNKEYDYIIGLEDQNFSFKKFIKLENIGFGYGDKLILNKLNLIIKRNEKICILGKNGSGKSTLIKLIAGLIEPDQGRILVDDKDLNKNLENWRNLIGYVGQEVNLIEGSLIENICLGIEEDKIDHKKLSEVIKQAQLHDFILKYDKNKNLGEFGKKISGGEKQKIALARSYYRSPQILLFDEATSAMDEKSENEIINSFKNLLIDKTVIFITHKKNYSELFDRVINLDE
tara:strand:+ start:74 stop:1759 length:1686 start_codon:yes stop_codon:yes gene_type:complete